MSITIASPEFCCNEACINFPSQRNDQSFLLLLKLVPFLVQIVSTSKCSLPLEFQAKFRASLRASAPIPRLKIKLPVSKPDSPSRADAVIKTESPLKPEMVKSEVPIKTDKFKDRAKSTDVVSKSDKPKTDAPIKSEKSRSEPRSDTIPIKSEKPKNEASIKSKSEKYHVVRMEGCFVEFKGREMKITVKLRRQETATDDVVPKPSKQVIALTDKEYVAEPAESSDDLSEDADAADLLLHRKKRQRVAELVQLPEKVSAAKEAKRLSEEEALKKAEQLKRRKEDMQVQHHQSDDEP